MAGPPSWIEHSISVMGKRVPRSPYIFGRGGSNTGFYDFDHRLSENHRFHRPRGLAQHRRYGPFAMSDPDPTLGLGPRSRVSVLRVLGSSVEMSVQVRTRPTVRRPLKLVGSHCNGAPCPAGGRTGRMAVRSCPCPRPGRLRAPAASRPQPGREDDSRPRSSARPAGSDHRRLLQWAAPSSGRTNRDVSTPPSCARHRGPCRGRCLGRRAGSDSSQTGPTFGGRSDAIPRSDQLPERGTRPGSSVERYLRMPSCFGHRSSSRAQQLERRWPLSVRLARASLPCSGPALCRGCWEEKLDSITAGGVWCCVPERAQSFLSPNRSRPSSARILPQLSRVFVAIRPTGRSTSMARFGSSLLSINSKRYSRLAV